MSSSPLRGQSASFHAQHSPLGAFASFTVGLAGATGGLAAQQGKPARQEVFVGVKDGPRESEQPIHCLPFFTGAAGSAEEARYLGNDAGEVPSVSVRPPPGHRAYALEQVERHYQWGTDRFVTPDFEFTLYTPGESLPDPDTAPAANIRAKLVPAVIATLTVDNSQGTQEKTAIFSLAFPEAGVRQLVNATGSGRIGFALGRDLGILGEMLEEGPPAFYFCRFTVAEGLRDSRAHRLGTAPGIGFVVPPGSCRTLRLALGVFLDGIVTTGLEARYLYARYFGSLEEVLSFTLDRAPELEASAHRVDERELSSKLSEDQRFLVGHAIRSYRGSTQLLEVAGRPFFVVNEGEYCMLNTLDLTIDHVFWELDQNPWVVRNVLDAFSRHYSYVDQCGISFCHDMGVNNHFSPVGQSSYELPELTGCFSFMTQEELCNWVLTAACYVARTKDDGWVDRNRLILEACSASLLRRAGWHGIMAIDSSRCAGGSEITTYDSLDESLGQARQNLYLAVKCWATHLALISLGIRAELSLEAAHRVASTILGHVGKSGVIPAVFEAGNRGAQARILPAIEALVYPLYLGDHCAPPLRKQVNAWLAPQGPFGDFLRALESHVRVLLEDPEGQNFFPDGGLRLSSTSDNSWISKIAIFQYVTRRLYSWAQQPDHRRRFEAADRAHVEWQRRGSGEHACSDQFVNGKAVGSRYYPRGVTAWLWVDEKVRPT